MSTIDTILARVERDKQSFRINRERERAVMRAYSEIKSRMRDLPDTPLHHFVLVTDYQNWDVGDYPVLNKGVTLLDSARPSDTIEDAAMRFALRLAQEGIIGGQS